jgi:hypothetical protein
MTTKLPDGLGVFVSPREALSNIMHDRRSAGLPLAAAIACSALLTIAYYQYVNYPWLADKLYAGYTQQQQRILTRVLDKQLSMVLGVTGIIVLTPAINGLVAAYLALIAKAQGAKPTFGDCFRLVCWSSLPAALMLPVGLLAIAMAPSGQLLPEELNPTSANSLLFHVVRPSAFLAPLSNLHLILIWQVALLSIGYHQATALSARKAAIIVCAPYCVLFGGWLLIAGLRATA